MMKALRELLATALLAALPSIAGAQADDGELTPPQPASASGCLSLVKNVPERGGWYRHVPSDTVIVFVHGIWSDSQSAWLTTRTPCAYWPKLVTEDVASLGAPAVYLGGYYAKPDSGSATISDAAAELFASISSGSGEVRVAPIAHAKIIFVAHSLGGVVVRKMLVDHASQFKDRTVGVVLFASPTGGSAYADILGWLEQYYPITLLRELKRDSGALQQLNEDFRELLKDRADQSQPIRVAEFFESRFPQEDCNVLRWVLIEAACKFVTGNMPEIVPKDRAGYFDLKPVRLGGTDHISIVKPSRVDDDAHRRLVLTLNTMGVIPVQRSAASGLGQLSAGGYLASGKWQHEGPRGDLVTKIGTLCSSDVTGDLRVCADKYELNPYSNPPKDGELGFVLVGQTTTAVIGAVRVGNVLFPSNPREKFADQDPVYSSVTNVINGTSLASDSVAALHTISFQPVRYVVHKEPWKAKVDVPGNPGSTLELKLPVNLDDAELVESGISGSIKRRVSELAAGARLGLLEFVEATRSGAEMVYRFVVKPKMGLLR